MTVKNVEKLEKSRVAVTVEVGAEEFEAAVAKAYAKARGKLSIPGFRPGKAPRKMIEKLYGAGVFYSDAVDIALPEAYTQAIGQSGLDVVGYPEVEIVDDKIDENGFTFKATVAVYPEVKLGEYKGLTAEKEEVKVSADDVKERLNEMAERNARLVSVDRKAKKGDIAVIDFEGFDNGEAFEGGKGENYELELGSGQFIPGFEDQVIGHNAGESFDVNVKFPEEYTPELAGKDATFKVTLHEIKMKELPELDDEFAKDLDYDNVDELRKGVEADMLEHRQSDADKEFEAKLMEELVANVEAEIPEVMFDTQKEENINNFAQRLAQQGIDVDTYLSYMGTDKDAFESSMREQAVSQVKLGLALDKIAELEKIEVGAEDIEEEFKKLAEMYNMEVEKIKSLIAEDLLKEDLLKEKVVKFVVDSAKALKPGKKPAAKKAPAKKAAAKKADDAEGEKKPAAKKSTAKKADGETAAKKPAAKKTAPKAEPKAEAAPKAAKATKASAKKTVAKPVKAERIEKAVPAEKPAAKKTSAKKAAAPKAETPAEVKAETPAAPAPVVKA